MTASRAIILVGVPGSGKSTYAATLRAAHPEMAYICPDVLRAELSGDANDQSANARIFTHMVPALINKAASQGRDICYDATNVTRKNRRGILEQLKAFGYYVEAHVLDVSLEECLSRNAARDKRVPDEVVTRMHAQLKSGKLDDEEIDAVIHIEGKPNADGTLTFWSY